MGHFILITRSDRPLCTIRTTILGVLPLSMFKISLLINTEYLNNDLDRIFADITSWPISLFLYLRWYNWWNQHKRWSLDSPFYLLPFRIESPAFAFCGLKLRHWWWNRLCWSASAQPLQKRPFDTFFKPSSPTDIGQSPEEIRHNHTSPSAKSSGIPATLPTSKYQVLGKVTIPDIWGCPWARKVRQQLFKLLMRRLRDWSNIRNPHNWSWVAWCGWNALSVLNFNWSEPEQAPQAEAS